MAKPYTAEDKMATMLLALTIGVAPAAEQRDTPGSTIYQWLNEGGGIVNIRNVAEAAMLNAGLEARRAIYGAVSERVARLSDPELMVTYRKQLEAEAETHGANEAATGAQAGATAIGALHVHVDGEEIIVPREDPE